MRSSNNDFFLFSIQISDAKLKQAVHDLLEEYLVQDLVKKVLKKGSISIRKSTKDDTFWDRRSRKIHISKRKNFYEIKSAILFELHNAINSHFYTDSIEKKLLKLSIQRVELSAAVFFCVAQEMEKDEFISLKNYKAILKNYSFSNEKEKTIFESKYIALLDEKNEIDYEIFKEQNLFSGHTLELAKLQFQNYTGLDSERLVQILPFRLKHPNLYRMYLEGKLRDRKKKEIDKILEEEN